jgi:hypothetical protein
MNQVSGQVVFVELVVPLLRDRETYSKPTGSELRS